MQYICWAVTDRAYTADMESQESTVEPAAGGTTLSRSDSSSSLGASGRLWWLSLTDPEAKREFARQVETRASAMCLNSTVRLAAVKLSRARLLRAQEREKIKGIRRKEMEMRIKELQVRICICFFLDEGKDAAMCHMLMASLRPARHSHRADKHYMWSAKCVLPAVGRAPFVVMLYIGGYHRCDGGSCSRTQH